MQKDNVGFVGLGRMGSRMALRLVDAFSVFGTDKVLALRPSAESNGVVWVDDSMSLASKCRYVFIVAGSEGDVTEIIFGDRGLIHGVTSDITIVVCATVRPSYMRALAEKLSQNQYIQLLDCPIARGEMAADSGELLLFVGGDRQVLDSMAPILSCIGSDIEFLGPIGAGQVAKAVNNYLLWACLTASTEGLDFGEKMGVDRERMRAALEKSSGANWAMSTRADERPALWAEKDMALFLAEADRFRFPAPIAGQVREAIKLFKLDRHLDRSPDLEKFQFPE
jgi:3-hydroxyisobutyrate dehydrogenase-like beta-hydroxyacid dehydrogenase